MTTLLRSLAAALYLAAAMATGWQVFQLIMWGVWGRRSHPVEFVALLGVLTLALGAAVTVGHRRRGSMIAIVGCGLLWAFYAPAVVATVGMASAGPYVVEVRAFLPAPLLLSASVVAAVVALWGDHKPTELDVHFTSS